MRRPVLAVVAAIATLFGGLTASQAQAGSLKDEPVVEACGWCGAYAGFSVGFGHTQNSIDFGFPLEDLDASRLLYGGHVGYNVQRGRWVFGAEADIAGFGGGKDAGPGRIIGGGGGGDTNVNHVWFSLLRARAGVLVTDNVLLYATAGLALTDIEIFEASSGLRAGQDVLVGFTVGAGVEAKLHGDWTMRIDYAYASFGREVLSGAPVFVDQTVEVDAHLLRLGVTRQFNWSR